jgi:hypothetical protein
VSEPAGPARTTLASRYLDRIGQAGIAASQLTGPLARSELLNALYQGRYLSRPVFIGQEERARLHADLENLREALISLPGRLFGGDLAAFASATGMTGYQREAIVREVQAGGRQAAAVASRLARVDLYADETGFHVLEFNMGSAIGGMDNPDICRALLQHPVLAGFAAEHGLGFTDTTSGLIDTIFAETGLERGSYPVVALANWPGRRPHMVRYMRCLAERWRGLGLDTHPCHVGELSVRNGRVWLGTRAVDVIYRMFPTAQLLQPEAPALMTPLLGAAERGEVVLFTPLASEMFGSKSALAMVCDDRNAHLFTAAERASIASVLPWTRLIQPDIVRYALDNQEGLVLKPAMLHGGRGVLLGWHPDTTEQVWRDRVVAAASAGDHVIQRRVHPVPELFPDENGGHVPWIVLWGAFTVAAKGTGSDHGGLYARAVPADGQASLITRDGGAFVGGCLAVQPFWPR